MKTKLLLITLLLIALTASFALADDGQMFRRNISKPLTVKPNPPPSPT